VTSKPVKASDLGVSIGQVLLGKYRVDAIIGQGGMGIVCACTHLRLNEKVAIKMLRPDVLLDQDALERFQREAQAAVKLKSEYVAHVQDVGVFENDVPFMVMEYLEGHDLAHHLDESGPIPVQWASDLMLQAAEALAEAHSIGIIHRDVKPTNLFLTWRPDGSSLVKVLDFGISKSRTGVDMQLTQTQSLLGTPAYMSPEQMRSAKEVDARTDIWSLGTVLYEIVEGHRPFEAESFSEMCVKVAVDPPLPMHNAPPALQQVMLRCLAKSPGERYASMAEVGAALVPFTKNASHAQMLVERMERVLRRSVPDAVPYPPMIDPASKPLPVLRARPAPAAAAPVSESLSGETTADPRPRRTSSFKKTVAIIAAAGIVVGIAVAFVLSGENKQPEIKVEADPAAKTNDKLPKTDDTNPPKAGGANPAKPDGTNPAKPDGTNPAKPDGTNPAKPDGTNPAKPDGTNPPKPDDVAKIGSGKPPGKAGTGQRKNPARGGTPTVKPTDDKTVKAVETTDVKTEPVSPPVDKPRCDPTKDYYGCTRNK
jgi:eukaryotic-like serine/threonine-protein kinase